MLCSLKAPLKKGKKVTVSIIIIGSGTAHLGIPLTEIGLNPSHWISLICRACVKNY